MWLDGGEPETSTGAMAAFSPPPTLSLPNDTEREGFGLGNF